MKSNHLEVNDLLIQLQSLDYDVIKNMLTFVVTCYVSGKLTNGYILNKSYKPQKIRKVSLPPELTQKNSTLDYKQLAAKYFGETAVQFAKVLIDNFDSSDLINFYNNINSVKIKPKKLSLDEIILKEKTAAIYFAPTNTIKVGKNISLFHELFHLTSTIIKGSKTYTGFSQTNTFFCIGDGINEGYTQLLAERYFGNIEGVKGLYPYETHIAKYLEQIVGRRKMESLYLNANLYGLIEELKLYSTEEEIMEFISGMDFLSTNLGEKSLFSSEKRKTEKLKTVTLFLIKTYSQKIINEINNDVISIEEGMQNLGEYIHFLGDRIIIGKKTYKFYEGNDLKNILNTLLKSEGISNENGSEKQK